MFGLSFPRPQVDDVLVQLWGLEQCPTVQALRVTNTFRDQNAQQPVWSNVQGTCFRTNTSSLLPSHSDAHRLIIQSTPLSLPSAAPLPTSPKLLPLFCVIPRSNPCSPTQLDSTVWFRTQTSLVVVVEVALSTHMGHMSVPRNV